MPLKGYKQSEEHKMKLDKVRLRFAFTKENHPRYWLGKKRPNMAGENSPSFLGRPDIRGANNPNWRGGTSNFRMAVINTSEYRIWRYNVYKRDNWTCQKCKIRSSVGKKVRLNAHHLKPYYVILKENHITNIEDAVKCSALFEINNGQTLCWECHKQTSSFAGKMKNIIKSYA